MRGRKTSSVGRDIPTRWKPSKIDEAIVNGKRWGNGTREFQFAFKERELPLSTLEKSAMLSPKIDI